MDDSIRRASKVLNTLLSGALLLNVTVLVIDYATRNNGGSSAADILTLFFPLVSFAAIASFAYILIKSKGKLGTISGITWFLLLAVICFGVATFLIESWIASQSYRYGG